MSAAATLPLWPLARKQAAAAAVGGDAHDVNAVTGWLGDVDRRLRAIAPLIIVRGEEVLAIRRVGRRRALAVAEDGRRERVPARAVVGWLQTAAVEACRPEVDAIVSATGISDPRLRAALVSARLQAVKVEGLYAVRPGPGASNLHVVRAARLGSRLSGFLLAQLASYGAFIASWAALGRAVFDDRVDGGALAAWALLLIGSVVLRLVAGALEGAIGIASGRALRERALAGALRFDPDDIRHQGTGQLTGRVLESEVAEDLVVGGGLLALVAVAELVAAIAVLTRGSSSVALPLLLTTWVVLAVGVGGTYGAARGRWTATRLAMTDRLVELVIGHRTRLAQCPPSRWHDGEDQLLTGYETASRCMDRRLAALLAVVPRGWVLVALLVLRSSTGSSADFAVALGGILLAFDALQRIVLASSQLADAAVAAAQVGPFVRAAALPRSEPRVDGGPPVLDAPVLSGNQLRFAHTDRAKPVLDGCDIVVHGLDRVVLQGASGAGKSTLVSVLAGLRRPAAGTLQLCGRGLDEVDEFEWRRRVSLSPQFHENHVLLGSLGFNVLIGRGWPPSPGDLEDAWAVCVELGLGPLLDRMPSGLAEMVGDTGWQLSQGERSLVYVARSLLQHSDVVLLDESFGSLDPVTMRNALATVVERAPALVVIRQ